MCTCQFVSHDSVSLSLFIFISNICIHTVPSQATEKSGKSPTTLVCAPIFPHYSTQRVKRARFQHFSLANPPSSSSLGVDHFKVFLCILFFANNAFHHHYHHHNYFSNENIAPFANCPISRLCSRRHSAYKSTRLITSINNGTTIPNIF